MRRLERLKNKAAAQGSIVYTSIVWACVSAQVRELAESQCYQMAIFNSFYSRATDVTFFRSK